MKIFIPNRARQGIGGGWRFTENIQKALRGKVNFINRWQDCDIYFIPGATLAERNEVEQAKQAGKKIVLRIDNLPRNSRNRNTGTSRLYDFAQMADEVVYQSQWSREFIMPFIRKDGEVILNGVDTSIFRPNGEFIDTQGKPQYLYIRYNRDETKRWELAWYWFQKEYFKNSDAHLWIAGRFSEEQRRYNFDLFGGAEKRYRYFGVVENPLELAKIYRSADVLLCPYSNEACSNVVAEALACGLKIKYQPNDSGGIPEQVEVGPISLEKMGEKYLKIFKKVYEKR